MPTSKQKPGSIPLALLLVVGEKEREKKTLKILDCQKSYFSMVTHGRGTASSKTLSYLGLGETRKNLYLSVRPVDNVRDVLDKLEAGLELGLHGHGIAFMADISTGCYNRPVKIVQQERESSMENAQEYQLIIIVVNQGYTDEVMDAARSAGAGGGTAIHGRGCGLAGAEKFFGVTIQPEKEVVLIAAPGEAVSSIMDAVAKSNGPSTDASAVSFALPLSDIRGISPEIFCGSNTNGE